MVRYEEVERLQNTLNAINQQVMEIGRNLARIAEWQESEFKSKNVQALVSDMDRLNALASEVIQQQKSLLGIK